MKNLSVESAETFLIVYICVRFQIFKIDNRLIIHPLNKIQYALISYLPYSDGAIPVLLRKILEK